MKKFLAILLAAMMLLSLAAPVLAAESSTTGSITINGVGTDTKYDVYKMLHLESYDTTTGAYSYTIEPAWVNFFNSADAQKYIVLDGNYVSWRKDVIDSDDNKFAFGKLALAYAKANDIDPTQSSENDGQFVITTNAETGVVSGKFSNLVLGYYLVDSTMGALCGLTTTNPDAAINAKNGQPTIDKQVQEDLTGQWGDSNSADIGQTVYFRVTINVHAGAENYILHDVMSEGLTYDKVSGVQWNDDGTVRDLVEGTDYIVFAAPEFTPDKTDDDTTDGCTLEVRFTKEFCDKLDTNDKIIVSYQAMLNRNALIADKNTNTAHLEYGEEKETTTDVTETFTFGFDIIKTDSANTLIDGAEFRIYDAEKGGNEVAVVLMDDGVTYRRARADEAGVDIVVKDGKVRVVGFDNGTYYLEETEAPDGYNKLTARQKFIISDANLDSIFTGEIYSSGSGVHVVNKTGSMLPETGSFGTTMFITVGCIVMLACGVLLFTRKRMSQIAE